MLLLCAHFQAYCRGLHTDAAQLLVEAIDPGIASVVDANLTFARQLDRSNAQPSAIGADFNRLVFEFWTVVKATDARNAARQRKLEELNDWRNAIAHHDIERHRADLHPHTVTIAACNRWAVRAERPRRLLRPSPPPHHLTTLLGSRPW